MIATDKLFICVVRWLAILVLLVVLFYVIEIVFPAEQTSVPYNLRKYSTTSPYHTTEIHGQVELNI